MKFRGKMNDIFAIRKFYNLLGMVGKLSKTSCVLRFTKEKFYFIVADNTNSSASAIGAVRCEMDAKFFFSEYQMEGVALTDPEIYLEIEPEKMAKTLNALKTTNAVRSLKIKLTRKMDNPCLSFEIELSSPALSFGGGAGGTSLTSTLSSGSRRCVHDVPINLIPRRLWEDFNEPELRRFDVSICLPELKSLKVLTERFKNLGSHFTISANKSGRLKLKLENDNIDVVAHFKDLEVPDYGDEMLAAAPVATQRAASVLPGAARGTNVGLDESSERRPDFVIEEERFHSVSVELKRFTSMLTAEQIVAQKVIANIVSGRMIHIFLIHEDLCVQFYIPAVHV